MRTQTGAACSGGRRDVCTSRYPSFSIYRLHRNTSPSLLLLSFHFRLQATPLCLFPLPLALLKDLENDMSLESENQAAQDALAQAAADRSVRTERQKMLAGEPYLAMTDADLTNGRLRTRPLLQAFNNAPWPRVPEDPQCFPTNFYGPDRRSVALKVERRCRGLTDYSACMRSVPPILRAMHSRRHESFSTKGHPRGTVRPCSRRCRTSRD